MNLKGPQNSELRSLLTPVPRAEAGLLSSLGFWLEDSDEDEDDPDSDPEPCVDDPDLAEDDLDDDFALPGFADDTGEEAFPLEEQPPSDDSPSGWCSTMSLPATQTPDVEAAASCP